MFRLTPTLLVTAILLLTVSLYCPVAVASDVFEATPTEQEDVNTIDEMDKGDSEVFEATPAEQDDMKSIDEISKGATSEVFGSDPIEQDDVNTIDQLND